MRKNNLTRIIDNFKGKKIAVIGDLMLDHFIVGDTERISPEAPVPVVLVSNEFSTLGGAGNVASNIATLGGKVSIIGMLGKDDVSEKLISEFDKRKINIDGIIKDEKKLTCQKIRVIARGQHVVRIDKEFDDYIDEKKQESVINFVNENIENWNVVVISDYVKGFITPKLAQDIIKLCNKKGKIVIADTKPKHASYFNFVSLLTPNYKEAKEISGLEKVEECGKKIQKNFNCNVLITQGSKGMTLFEKNEIYHFPANVREIFDVGGAGDTVVAALALSLASGASLKEASLIANYAAGIVVSKIGTATVSRDELKNVK